MKKSLLLCAILCIVGVQNEAQAQPNWHTLYPGPMNRAIDYTSNNEYLATGLIEPPLVNGWNNAVPQGSGWRNLGRIHLLLNDAGLNPVWHKTYVAFDEITYLLNGICPSLSTEFNVTDAKQTANGDYIVIGSVRRDGETGMCGPVTYSTAYMMRTNSIGLPLWYHRYESGGPETFRSVVETTDGGFMVCGSVGGTWTEEAMIMKTDGMGNIQWTQTVSVPAYWNPSTALRSEYMEVVNFGNDCALVGYGNHSLTMFNTMVTIVDNNGAILQNKLFDPTPSGVMLTPYGLCVTSDNKLAITGDGGQPCQSGAHFMVMKVDPVTMNADYIKMHGPALGDYNSYAAGRSITCIGDRLCVAGVDWSNTYPNGTGLYAEVDNISGNIMRYALGDPTYYRAGVAIDQNTNLAAPAFSGFTTNVFETSLVVNEYNVDCYISDVAAGTQDIVASDFYPWPTPILMTDIPDKIFAYDLPVVPNNVCQPQPKTGDAQAPVEHSSISLYPSKTASVFTLSSSSQQQLSYEIITMDGRTLVRGKVASGTTVDVSQLAQGMYIVSVTAEDGTSEALKLMKE